MILDSGNDFTIVHGCDFDFVLLLLLLLCPNVVQNILAFAIFIGNNEDLRNDVVRLLNIVIRYGILDFHQ